MLVDRNLCKCITDLLVTRTHRWILIQLLLVAPVTFEAPSFLEVLEDNFLGEVALVLGTHLLFGPSSLVVQAAASAVADMRLVAFVVGSHQVDPSSAALTQCLDYILQVVDINLMEGTACMLIHHLEVAVVAGNRFAYFYVCVL